MFSYDQIRSAVAAASVPALPEDISLPVISSAARIGVGRDGSGSFVLVGPGQASALVLEGKHYRFEPWTDLIDRKSGSPLRDVCVLRFKHDSPDDSVTNAVVAVFAGLVETAASAPTSLGRTIGEMTHLFEMGLRASASPETELGLAGELLVILEAVHPVALAHCWHKDFHAQFDFSTQGERLEVKTTSGPERIHWFSSGQLAPIPGVCTSFVSIVMPRVEVGSTVASLFERTQTMPSDVRAHIRSVILDAAKAPPELLTSVVFDAAAGRASLLHVSPSAIPSPVRADGVGRMRWEATLPTSSEAPAPGCGFRDLVGV